MRYEIVSVYGPADKTASAQRWRGWGVLDIQNSRFASTGFYRTQEFDEVKELRDKLEEGDMVMRHWPHSQDSEVMNRINDSEFLKTLDSDTTFAYRLHQAKESVARERAQTTMGT